MFHERFAGRAVAGDDVDARGENDFLEICANASAVSEVNSAGFSTTVLPVASAGRSSGQHQKRKIHGMIWPTTPQAV
jgi:hypothetical protein